VIGSALALAAIAIMSRLPDPTRALAPRPPA
jgi:hypothetical protein